MRIVEHALWQRLRTRLRRGLGRLRFRLAMRRLGLRLTAPPAFNALLVRKRRGQLQFVPLKNYETRNESAQALMRQADAAHPLPDFDWWLINTDDQYEGATYQGLRVLSYAVPPGHYAAACPDFLFDHWRQTRLDDYETTRLALMADAVLPPRASVLGWRGAETHPVRRLLIDRFGSAPGFDVALVSWDRTNPGRLGAAQFLSLEQQQQSWRFLIDLEGRGYSARLKLLLATGRVVFIQARESHEFYYEHLQPWVHYVPVKADLSDLQAHLDRVLAEPALEQSIREQALRFVATRLSRASAEQVFRERLTGLTAHTDHRQEH